MRKAKEEFRGFQMSVGTTKLANVLGMQMFKRMHSCVLAWHVGQTRNEMRLKAQAKDEAQAMVYLMKLNGTKQKGGLRMCCVRSAGGGSAVAEW